MNTLSAKDATESRAVPPARSSVPLLPAVVVLGVVAVVGWAARSPVEREIPRPTGRMQTLGDVSSRVDAFQSAAWSDAALRPAGPATELAVLRRLSLALHGTIPSLEEIRRFEADTQPERLTRWTESMLADRRFADYFAERLARSYVGTEPGQFILYRRDRFTGWLSERLHANRPYDEVVRQMVASDGLWTGQPATNFLTSALDDGDFDENRLAARTARAFLGQRIDCAQCHDHPFDSWKQSQFEGLAAFYGQTRIAFDGVRDHLTAKGKPLEYRVQDRTDPEKFTVVLPSVPFGAEWLPAEGNRREQLAAWVTHPENRRFERAVVNRVWGLLFGRPLHQPVDDVPAPGAEPDLLDVLGRDFRAHGCDLRRLVLAITATEPFRTDSVHPAKTEDEFWRHEQAGAVFPLTPLRPEQLIGAMIQAASVKTVDQRSSYLVRVVRFFREQDFVRAYGDAEGEELEKRSGTVTQALLRMNGRLTRDLSAANPFTATGRIAATAGSDEKCLETLFLVTLTRRPTAEEVAALLPQLAGKSDKQRQRAVEDVTWALLNAEEFSWNH